MVTSVMSLWYRACIERANLPADFATAWWERILAHYTEPQRHYHTVTHLEELCALHRQLDDARAFHDPWLVVWTIFFHDIIYDPKRNDNEDKSADVWLQFSKQAALEGYHDAQQTETVRRYIKQTQNHTSCPDDADKDLHLFLDMDLAILGAPRERYAEYADQIAREYAHYPRAAYCEGRAQVLRNFAKSDSLFRTPELAERFLATARENLRWEITQLESPPMVTEPLYFADRVAVAKFERESRVGDPLRVGSDDINHMLSMNTGKMCMAFRHAESKSIQAHVLATLAESSELAAGALQTAASSSNAHDRTREDVEALIKQLTALDGYSVGSRSECNIHGDHLIVHSIAVAKALRRRGIATKLIKDYLSVVETEMPHVRRVTALVPACMVPCVERMGFVACGGARVAQDFTTGGLEGQSPRADDASIGTGGSPMSSICPSPTAEGARSPKLANSATSANLNDLREVGLVIARS